MPWIKLQQKQTAVCQFARIDVDWIGRGNQISDEQIHACGYIEHRIVDRWNERKRAIEH